MSLATRSLSEQDAASTTFTRQQNRSVLIAGLTCACFSLLATFVTLRWFILMKRQFRHKLVMFLIFSDTFKAFWYFVFPVVVFSRGPISSSSGFCQASGFFLAVGIEASDFAILMIALHSILYIFHPPARSGDGAGLYRFRRYIYVAWIAFPLLAASLAFVNDRNAYTTAGTFCYLPRRPIWYRLALSWIPRYIIMGTIFFMYTLVYVYVTLKFRSFSNLHEPESQYSSASQSRRSSMSGEELAPNEQPPQPPAITSPRQSKLPRPAFSRSGSYQRESEGLARESDPWDEVSFITTRPLRRAGTWQPGVQSSDYAFGPRHMSQPPSGTQTPQPRDLPIRHEPGIPESRKSSNAPTTNSQNSQMTGSTATTLSQEVHASQVTRAVQKLSTSPMHTKPKDPLRRTRKAIRKQLRYLFIYPLVYVLMWIFPFASHCLLYDDYYVLHPIYWLTIVSTCMFSLQAGVDCVVFSWREKPWRRIPANSRFSFSNFRSSFSMRAHADENGSAMPSISMDPNGESGPSDNPFASGASSRNTSNHWWEAEGRKRKDSVWMGTDANSAAANGSEPSSTQNGLGTLVDETIEEEHEPPLSNVQSADLSTAEENRIGTQQGDREEQR